MSPFYIGTIINYGSLTAIPTSPAPTEGSEFWHSTENKKYFYNGTSWQTAKTSTVFTGANATHWWKSEGIASTTSWVAEKGGSGANFVAGTSDGEMTYTASDSDLNNQKSLRANPSGGNTGLTTSTNSEDTYWDGTEAWSVLMMIYKEGHSQSGSLGDGLFVHTHNNTDLGSWSVDQTGDHTWGGEFGEMFSWSASPSAFPNKGIFLCRMNANGANGSIEYYDGSSWSTRDTGSSLPSSLGTSFAAINIFNFQTTSSSHAYRGKISEIAYYKGTRISDNERDSFTDYAKDKFWG